jgi:hypothetical protein
MLVGSSETTRVLSTSSTSPQETNDLNIRQWIAGVIDGDGYFGVSRKGYCSLEIVMEPRDAACLYKIKQRYGGSIKPSSHANALRYRLHHREGITTVINDLNGLLYNPVRLGQFTRLCGLYGIKLIASMPLTYDNAYLSGLFDSDGSIYYNITAQQVILSISQKHPYLLTLIMQVYGGKIYSSNAAKTASKWTVNRKADVLSLARGYFHDHACVSAKNKRFGMVEQFYVLSANGVLKGKTELDRKMLSAFMQRWDNFGE